MPSEGLRCLGGLSALTLHIPAQHSTAQAPWCVADLLAALGEPPAHSLSFGFWLAGFLTGYTLTVCVNGQYCLGKSLVSVTVTCPLAALPAFQRGTDAIE